VTDQLRDNVGWLVRERRVALGMSQEELARRLGMKREYLSQIETGKPKWPQKYIPALSVELAIPEVELALAAGKIKPVQQYKDTVDYLYKSMLSHLKRVGPYSRVSIAYVFSDMLNHAGEDQDVLVALREAEVRVRDTLNEIETSTAISTSTEELGNGVTRWLVHYTPKDSSTEKVLVFTF